MLGLPGRVWSSLSLKTLVSSLSDSLLVSEKKILKIYFCYKHMGLSIIYAILNFFMCFVIHI